MKKFKFYKEQIDTCRHRLQESFVPQGKKAWLEFSAKYSKGEDVKRRSYNLFWANVRTIRPNLFFQTPPPRVKRRRLQDEPTSRAAAEILQHNLEFNLAIQSFEQEIRDAVTDLLVPGRGQCWVTLDSKIEDEYKPVVETEDGYADPQSGMLYPSKVDVVRDDNGQLFAVLPKVSEQKACVEALHWLDYMHSEGRRWREVWWVARRHWLTEEKLEEMLKNKGVSKVSEKLDKLKFSKALGQEDRDGTGRTIGESEESKRAAIWELWDKDAGKVIWLPQDVETVTGDVLLEEEPPVDFREFFPCPKPLLATCDDDDLEPYSDFLFYQAQAASLDALTCKIEEFSNMLEFKGLFNAALGPEDSNPLEELGNGEFKASESWPSFAQNGGWEGNVIAFPTAQIAETLTSAINARQVVKAEADEIAGIFDLMRGQSDPRELATSQKIKKEFGASRMEELQLEIQRFVEDLYGLQAEVIAEHFTDENLFFGAGIDLNNPQVDPAKIQQAQAAIQLLREDRTRTFAIEIVADSHLRPDKQASKQQAAELLQAWQGVLGALAQARQTDPALMPVAIEVIMKALRGFSDAQELEDEIEKAFQALIQQMQQAAQQPQQPDPTVVAQQQRAQADAQIAQFKVQEANLNLQRAQMLAQSDVQKSQLEAQLSQLKMALEEARVEIERFKANTDRIEAEADMIEAQTDVAQTEIQGFEAQERVKTERMKVASDALQKERDRETTVQVQREQRKNGANRGGSSSA